MPTIHRYAFLGLFPLNETFWAHSTKYSMGLVPNFVSGTKLIIRFSHYCFLDPEQQAKGSYTITFLFRVSVSHKIYFVRPVSVRVS